MSSSLVLGTVQLGMNYGIANKTGQPSEDSAKEIIRVAWEHGIHEFDTARGYGDSEVILGNALSQLGISSRAHVISKFNPVIDCHDFNAMSTALDESLTRLNVPCLYGMMLHRESTLSDWENGVSDILYRFVSSRKVRHLGVSVYSPAGAIQALNTKGIDIIQLPTNVLDRRFEKAGVFELAHEKKKRIYIRSVFLQGLILMDVDEIPGHMSFAKPVIEKLESFSRDVQMSRQDLALGYIKSEMAHAKVIFGSDTPEQVKENLASWTKELPSSIVPDLKDLFNNVDEQVLNPVLWPN